MQLLEIQEPEDILKRDRSVTAVGIDLGTTYSLVAYSIDQNPVIIPDELLESKTPSIIAITKEQDLLVGNKATIFYGHDNVKIISSAKRLMGQSTVFNVHGKEIAPVEVASHILSKLKSIAEQHLKKEVVQAVITVPAYFDEAQRQATKQAAKLAGLEVLRIINEPTAAALAYGLDKGKEGIYVIYDLGGGTFDVSVLKMTQGVFQVLATGGDTNLGGDDIDAALATEIAKRTGDAGNKAPLKQARDIKEHLSTHSSFELSSSACITRAELEAIMQPLIEGSIRITSRVIRDAKISASAVSGIVLVGGSTRIPLVKRRLQESFPDIKVYDDADPGEIVAMGAAIQAENLTYGSNNLLLDVTPLSLGIELLGGTVEKIILKNTTIPASVSKEFTTYEDGQTGMQFHIVQGEREMAKDCRSLARLELQNLSPQKAGSVHVQVTFTVDADGLLTVTAIDTHTKEKQQIKALPSYGLTAEKMEEMLLESINNAEQDIEMKMETEAIIHARQLLLQVTKSIEEDRDLLSEKEYQEIVSKIQQLENNIAAKDRHSINNAVNELEKAVRKFLELKVDKYMNLALRGTKVDAY